MEDEVDDSWSNLVKFYLVRVSNEEALSPGCHLHVHHQGVAGVHHTVFIRTKQHLSNQRKHHGWT